MAGNLSDIYHDVMIDVINNVREEFVNDGVDEDILQQLKSLWELKLMHLVRGVHDNSRYVGSMGPASINNLNMSYERESPTAGLVFPPTPVQTPAPSFVPASRSFSTNDIHDNVNATTTTLGRPAPYMASAAPSFSTNDIHDNVNATTITLGRPAPYMASPWKNQRIDLNAGLKLDMNVAYDGGEEDKAAADGHITVTKDLSPPRVVKRRRANAYGSGSHLPQHDGSGDAITIPCSLEQAVCASKAQNPFHESGSSLVGKEHLRKHTELKMANVAHMAVPLLLPQFDGGFQEDYSEMVAEDYNDNLPVEEEDVEHNIAVHEQLRKNLQAGASGALEPPLGEDDDDLEVVDDLLNPDACFETENVVYAQFEKVSRLKSKWKCILRDGIMHLKDQDYLFSKATGVFEF